ncbi:MAG: acyl-CoA dehydrogenase family protein [Bacteroidales bacterium]|nr:acyl-CoA dehydrogenase family protein [Bacteroidales bacterium]
MENFYSDNPHLKFHLTHPLMEKIVKLKESGYTEKEKYDFAPLDFEDAIDNYDKVMEIIGEISGEIIGPNAESVDKEGPELINNEVIYARGTRQNYDALVKAGLVGFTLPRQYDGLNLPVIPYIMTGEVISRADAGFANIWGLQDCAETIHEFASDEIKAEFLPRFHKGATAAMDLTEPDAGSDLQAVQLKATYDNHKHCWLLDGVKRFITNGDADISLVLARSEEGTTDARGLSLFVYDRNHKAVNVRRIENKLGIKGSPTCELVFKNAPAKLIGDTKMGLIKYVMSLMNSARLGVGSQSVGIAEAAYREAYKYAMEREQFGKAIIKYPAVYEMLTNMRVKIDAMRTLLYETARYVDIYKAYNFASHERKLESEERQEAKSYQKLADMFTPLLKLYSSEGCNQIAYDAIQIFGGTGYMKDFPIERIYRDARITTIYEGTSQLQVVAAIRGVGNGAYLAFMQDRAQFAVKPELEYLKSTLVKMTEQYTKTVEKVNEFNDNEYLDFHARRLVEMAGNVLIGYLLLYDANRNDVYAKSADIFIRKGRAENISAVSFINNCHPKDVNDFKI